MPDILRRSNTRHEDETCVQSYSKFSKTVPEANLDMDAVVAADPDALKKYQNVDALLDPVRRGSLAPLSGRYLVELAEGWRVRP